MDRKQRELVARQQQLVREQRVADQERLISALNADLGFHQGNPVAAVVVFRSFVHWKAIQQEKGAIFERVSEAIGMQIESFQEDNWPSGLLAHQHRRALLPHAAPHQGGRIGERELASPPACGSPASRPPRVSCRTFGRPASRTASTTGQPSPFPTSGSRQGTRPCCSSKDWVRSSRRYSLACATTSRGKSPASSATA